jgi:streptogramin lyase
MRTPKHYINQAKQFVGCLILVLLCSLHQNSWGQAAPRVHSRITLVDQQGRVWLAATPGLQLLEGTKRLVFTTREGLSNDTVTALAQDAQGQIWVGTHDGLQVVEGNGFREISYAQGLPSKQINRLYQSPNGPLWIATAQGALTYTNRHLESVAALRGIDVEFVGEDTKDWVFVTSQGIRRLPKEQPFNWQWLAWAAGGLLLLGGGLWTRCSYAWPKPSSELCWPR